MGEDSLKVGYIGPSIDCSYAFTHIGLDTSSLISLLKGKHPFSYELKKSKNPSIILGERFNHNNIYKLITKLSALGCLTSLKYSNIYPLRAYSSSVSFIIYIGSHYSVYNLEMADLILPSSVFIEKDFKVINLENVIKESKSLRQISGDIRSEWF